MGEARRRVTAFVEAAVVPLSIRDIALLAGVSPSSAHRTVAALVDSGRFRRRRVRGDPRVYVERVRGRVKPLKPWTPKQRLLALGGSAAPVFVLEQKGLARYGIHRQIGPLILVAERWVERLDLTGLRYATFRHSRPLEQATKFLDPLEVFLAVLQLEPDVAKEMWDGGVLKKTDPRRLRRRLRAEGLVGPAEAIGVSLDRRRADPRDAR